MHDQFEHIEAYFDGSLAGEAKARFEAALKEDSQLRSAVENYSDAMKISEGLLELDVANVINKLQATESDSSTETEYEVEVETQVNSKIDRKPSNTDRRSMKTNRSPLNWSTFTKVMVALLFLGGAMLVMGWFSQKQKQADRERIFASYIRPIDADASKSIDTVGMSLFEKGKYYFALNRFGDSEYWLERAVEKPTGEGGLAEIYFWLGAAHIEQWEVEEAISAWERSGNEDAFTNLKIITKN